MLQLCRRLSTKPSLTSLLSSSSSPPWASAFNRSLSSPPAHEKPNTVSPNPNFAAQYLINSCGVPADKAARASRYLPHLKSSEKPDSVLRFLREAGVTEAHIKAAALRDPAFLCYSIEKCFKPRMAELQEIGFSSSDISFLLSVSPVVFGCTKLQQKVQFWLGFLDSIEKLLCALKRSYFLLTTSLEKTIMPNIAFLQEHCKLSAGQIARLVNVIPSTILSKPDVFKMHVKRAQDLGVLCSSGMFVHALSVVTKLNEGIVAARVHYLKGLGFSQEEVTLLITKCPTLLSLTEKLIGEKMEFLLKEAGCAKMDVLVNPSMLTLSLEKHLIPRSVFRKLLRSKGIPAANNAFVSFAQLNEKKFLDKFVLPYEGTLPGLHQAYTDACAWKTTAAE